MFRKPDRGEPSMDDEVTVMFQIAKTLEELDEESRARVIRWAADKYGVDVGQPGAGESSSPAAGPRQGRRRPGRARLRRGRRQGGEARVVVGRGRVPARSRPGQALVPGHVVPHVQRQEGAEEGPGREEVGPGRREVGSGREEVGPGRKEVGSTAVSVQHALPDRRKIAARLANLTFHATFIAASGQASRYLLHERE